MDALSECRVAPLCPAELEFPELHARAAALPSANLGHGEFLLWDGHFLSAPVDISRCPIKAQLWLVAGMAGTCWSILRVKYGSAGKSRPPNLRSGRFWVPPRDRPCCAPCHSSKAAASTTGKPAIGR